MDIVDAAELDNVLRRIDPDAAAGTSEDGVKPDFPELSAQQQSGGKVTVAAPPHLSRLFGLLSKQRCRVDLDVIARAFASPGRVSANHGPCPPVTAAHPRTAAMGRVQAHKARRVRVGLGHVETPHKFLVLVEVSGPKLRRRYTPLKAVWMEIYEPIVTHAKLACRMNLRTRQVELKTTEETARACATLPPGLGLAAATSAPGLDSPLTILHQDWTRSANTLPHLHRDC